MKNRERDSLRNTQWKQRTREPTRLVSEATNGGILRDTVLELDRVVCRRRRRLCWSFSIASSGTGIYFHSKLDILFERLLLFLIDSRREFNFCRCWSAGMKHSLMIPLPFDDDRCQSGGVSENESNSGALVFGLEGPLILLSARVGLFVLIEDVVVDRLCCAPFVRIEKPNWSARWHCVELSVDNESFCPSNWGSWKRGSSVAVGSLFKRTWTKVTCTSSTSVAVSSAREASNRSAIHSESSLYGQTRVKLNELPRGDILTIPPRRRSMMWSLLPISSSEWSVTLDFIGRINTGLFSNHERKMTVHCFFFLLITMNMGRCLMLARYPVI